MEAAASHDPGNEHGVIYMWGTTGIGYNIDMVAERLGEDFEVDTWDPWSSTPRSPRNWPIAASPGSIRRPTCSPPRWPGWASIRNRPRRRISRRRPI
jgi:hypothetical protein